MPKSRKRKRKSGAASPDGSAKHDGFRMHAMPTFTPEQRSAFQKAAIAHGAERAIALPQIIAKIDELLRSIYPPLLLAVVAN